MKGRPPQSVTDERFRRLVAAVFAGRHVKEVAPEIGLTHSGAVVMLRRNGWRTLYLSPEEVAHIAERRRGGLAA